MKTVCEGRLDGRRRKERPPISLKTNLTTACGLSLHQIVQKSQDRAGWQQKVRSSIATATTASGDADSVGMLDVLILQFCDGCMGASLPTAQPRIQSKDLPNLSQRNLWVV
ncbi:hypothetical protein ElyMa_003326600 [Elysia marginata]|uniref:Uncharacterized protein n=1 Tax=Elysia marginata TaxID=1093978 RepID=A0AAV4JE46_9GAST|nr:hypothetical protein ElyMa_003326600 [Elysia marginata]